MKKGLLVALIVGLFGTAALAQDLNKIVFGPLEGDDAGVLNVRNADDIEIEMWVRTDPDNPTPIVGIAHGLLSEDAIIAVRNGVEINPDYDIPYWEITFVDGPYIYNPADDYPIPPGYTSEMQGAIYAILAPYPGSYPLDTEGEWDYYGAFLMTCNTDVPIDDTYYPFSMGWYPQNNNSTLWAFDGGGSVVPEQDYCGLYFETDACIYIPGDCNHNGVPLELNDVIAMGSSYRGSVEPYYDCNCGVDPPGYRFIATADPNGNCVANELSDVVTEIAAYRGLGDVSGCPDCPGSRR